MSSRRIEIINAFLGSSNVYDASENKYKQVSNLKVGDKIGFGLNINPELKDWSDNYKNISQYKPATITSITKHEVENYLLMRWDHGGNCEDITNFHPMTRFHNMYGRYPTKKDNTILEIITERMAPIPWLWCKNSYENFYETDITTISEYEYVIKHQCDYHRKTTMYQIITDTDYTFIDQLLVKTKLDKPLINFDMVHPIQMI